jgi:hypothetical protein
MYQEFANTRIVTTTRTNVRLYLTPPNSQQLNFTNYVSVILDGTMEVFTQDPIRSVWEDKCALDALPWSVGDMPSQGQSSLGLITMNGNPNRLTTGIIRQNCSESAYPGTLEAAVFQILDIPGYGLLHNEYPVIIQGVVDSIPPFHTEAKCGRAILFDESGVARGMIGGRSLTILDLAPPAGA